MASPAKSNPITSKSKSPLKINEALVSGASLTGKKFVDVAAEVGKVFEEKKEPIAADLSIDKNKTNN
jgi:hypothetical protein